MNKLNALTTWDLSPLFESDDSHEIEKERKELIKQTNKFVKKWENREDYLKEPKVLKEALDEYENWCTKWGTTGNQGYYFGLRRALKTTDPKIKAQNNKISDLATDLYNKIQFFDIRIAKIPKKEQAKFLKYKPLKEYMHYLKKGFEAQKYILSEPEEKIMNFKQKTSLSNWTRMTSEFFSKEERLVLNERGKKVKKNFSEIQELVSNKSKSVRKSAATAIEDILKKHLDVVEHEINTICENLKVDMKIRGFKRPDAPRHLDDDIDSKVVDSLVTAVSSRNYIPKRFYKLKNKLLNLKQLEYYERNVEYGKITKKYPYKKACELVYETFLELDENFADIYKKFLENGQVDAFPRKGKVGGAFCTYNSKLNPVYILLNHTNRLNDVLTTAHEMGHAINNEFVRKSQNELNFGTPTSTAEVASTFMEDFVLQKLLKETDGEEKLAVMMSKLGGDVASIFRQIAFYRFETELHNTFQEKGYLSNKKIGRMFKKHMQAYMGPVSKGSENWWSYVSHFRRFFYVYSYASGLLISKSLQAEVKKDSKYIESVKKFLSAGLSDSPKNIFMKLGVDITKKSFWDKGLDEVEQLLTDTEKLAKELGKI